MTITSSLCCSLNIGCAPKSDPVVNCRLSMTCHLQRLYREVKRALRSVYVDRNPADSQPSPATPAASEPDRQWFLLDARTQRSRCQSLATA